MITPYDIQFAIEKLGVALLKRIHKNLHLFKTGDVYFKSS